MIATKCPNCAEELDCLDGDAGKINRCPECEQKFRVPEQCFQQKQIKRESVREWWEDAPWVFIGTRIGFGFFLVNMLIAIILGLAIVLLGAAVNSAYRN